jgi:hypothetical protein
MRTTLDEIISRVGSIQLEGIVHKENIIADANSTDGLDQ